MKDRLLYIIPIIMIVWLLINSRFERSNIFGAGGVILFCSALLIGLATGTLKPE